MTIEEIKQANKNACFTFFGKRDMEAFDSIVYEDTFGRYFITSERPPKSSWEDRRPPRTYKVRYLTDRGSVVTISSGMDTLFEAKREAQKQYEKCPNWETC